VVSVKLRPLFTLGKDPVTIVQEAGWAPGPVWTGAENLDPTGIRSPDRPARSQSLQRLCYPVHLSQKNTDKVIQSYFFKIRFNIFVIHAMVFKVFFFFHVSSAVSSMNLYSLPYMSFCPPIQSS
jgi:hypothetical protein